MWRAIVVLWALGSVASAQAPAPMPDRTERLVAAAKLWARAKFFHPYLAYKDLDWDGVLVRALPKLDAATTIDQFRAALAEMLAALGDPVTRIEPQAAAPQPTSSGPVVSWPTPSILQVDMASFVAGGFDAPQFAKRGTLIEQAAAAAKSLVIDLRTPEPAWVVSAAITYFENALPAIETWPVQRVIEHRGWVSSGRHAPLS
jgi:hypothetical protein